MIIIFVDVNARKFLKKYYKMQKMGRESSSVCVRARAPGQKHRKETSVD